jgi:hypothetical protein
MVLLLPHMVEPTEGRGFSLIWGVWTLPYTRIELCGKLFRLLKEGVLRVSHNAPYAGSSWSYALKKPLELHRECVPICVVLAPHFVLGSVRCSGPSDHRLLCDVRKLSEYRDEKMCDASDI